MHCIFFILFSFFLIKERLNYFPIMEYTFISLLKNVGVGISTLMSISDGLSPSIFCRKMEKTRPGREEMDGNFFDFPPKSNFRFDLISLSSFLYFYLDLAYKQLCLPPRKRYN